MAETIQEPKFIRKLDKEGNVVVSLSPKIKGEQKRKLTLVGFSSNVLEEYENTKVDVSLLDLSNFKKVVLELKRQQQQNKK